MFKKYQVLWGIAGYDSGYILFDKNKYKLYLYDLNYLGTFASVRADAFEKDIKLGKHWENLYKVYDLPRNTKFMIANNKFHPEGFIYWIDHKTPVYIGKVNNSNPRGERNIFKKGIFFPQEKHAEVLFCRRAVSKLAGKLLHAWGENNFLLYIEKNGKFEG